MNAQELSQIVIEETAFSDLYVDSIRILNS
jgi:hypothetical protein